MLMPLMPFATASASPVETILYAFSGNADGGSPNGALVMDEAGNLYGTAFTGGLHHDGAVYELTPPAAGATSWTETVIFSFDSHASGRAPGAGLVFDGKGNLYGTASIGGAGKNGVVFKLSPPAAGTTTWKQTILYAFTGADGSEPFGQVTFGTSGNLYGTTSYGGATGNGVVFALSPPARKTAAWTETVLYSFGNYADPNGSVPAGGITVGPNGALYGAAEFGGGGPCVSATMTFGCGTIFMLTPPNSAGGAWTFSSLYSFAGQSDGAGPQQENLLLDSAGNLYGTSYGWSYGTQAGSPASLPGSVFKLSPPATGQTAWSLSTLASFPGGKSSAGPFGSITADSAGDLFAVTDGFKKSDYGSVFEIKAAKTFKTLFRFSGTNGRYPDGDVILDKHGTLYGVTYQGGASNEGVVFRVTQ